MRRMQPRQYRASSVFTLFSRVHRLHVQGSWDMPILDGGEDETDPAGRAPDVEDALP